MRTSHPLRAAVLILSAVAVLGVPAWAAFAPIASDSREAVYEIPKGTFARRQAGEKFDLIPAEIRLTLGVKDVLVMKNQDDVPHLFGPVLIMPDQTFRLPFRKASTYLFTCPLHTSGMLTIVVEPEPELGWTRLRWRTTAQLASAF
ncbi:MAG TPA: hypothetical protein VMU79_02505 [Casimicrobiaceae bacterium]|jgi:hypothetical protein|nr:hypothetical protein [Casimicrobiaceae bacterium]